jgi:RimJ/RimL family protein N-acetyltransferase
LSVPYQDSAETGRLILRDGTAATVRLAHAEDRASMAEFFARLSKDSQRIRFFSLTQPSAKLIETFCDDSDPRKQLCLIVMPASGGASRIIASANYMARNEATAEIALAVDDAFHGKGIGSLLLERLAVLAVRNGFNRFWAITLPDNQQMLDVFRKSGFECRSRANDGGRMPARVQVSMATLASRRGGSIMPSKPRKVISCSASSILASGL